MEYTIENLSKMTIIQLRELGKKNNIKGCTNKKKDVLVEFLNNELSAIQQREKINHDVDEIFETNESDENDEKISELINNFIDNIDEKVSKLNLEESDKKKTVEMEENKPIYYFLKFDYINKDFNKESIESLLQKKLKFGDIVQFDEHRAKGSFIVTENNMLRIDNNINTDLCIPLLISQKMSNCIELYKDIHEDFYGIELSKDHPYVLEKLGVFEIPNNCSIYYVNQDIFEDEIHIYMETDEPFRISFSEESKKNKYNQFRNSAEFIQKYDLIMKNGKYETYGLYLTLKNTDNTNLEENEYNYVYNIEIPDYCILDIDFQCYYYQIKFTYLKSNKEKMIKFINSYYFDNTHDFISEIEPIIDE